MIQLSSTVDSIIQEGTHLYNEHRAERTSQGKVTSAYLMINELPDHITLRGLTYIVKRLELVYTGLLGTACSDMLSLTYSISDAVHKVFKSAKVCFMTLGPPASAFTSAICQLDDKFVCFDSHSRDKHGLRCETGKAVIIETTSLASLVSYIKDLATSLFHSSATDTQFEFVSVFCETIMTNSGVYLEERTVNSMVWSN